MTSIFHDLMVYLPNIVGWSVAIVFCILRRRENPKGVVYLSLAILMQLLWLPLRYGVPYLYSLYSGPELPPVRYLGTYFFVTINTLTLLPSWLLITMAVFARPKHYDFLETSPFDSDPS